MYQFWSSPCPPDNATRFVADARDPAHGCTLSQANVKGILRETFDSSVRAGRNVLENLDSTDHEATRIRQTCFKVDWGATRDLALFWKAGQPVHLNEACIAWEKQLEAGLKLALLAKLDGARTKDKAAEQPDEPHIT